MKIKKISLKKALFILILGIVTLCGSSVFAAVEVIVETPDGGRIEPSGKVEVTDGTIKEFKLYPNQGYILSDLQLETANAASKTSVKDHVINYVYNFGGGAADHKLYVSFKKGIQYHINAEAGTGGSITPAGDVAVDEGLSQTFSVTPDEGYGIADVTADDASVGAVSAYVFENVTAEGHKISVSFVKQYAINVTPPENADISPDDAVLNVNEGATQAVTISPKPGYEVSDITVDENSVKDKVQTDENGVITYTFEGVNADHSFAVSLVQKHKITATSGEHGKIEPGTDVVNHGTDSKAFKIVPDQGYVISSITVDKAACEIKGATYTFKNVVADHSIHVAFKDRRDANGDGKLGIADMYYAVKAVVTGDESMSFKDAVDIFKIMTGLSN